MPKWQQYRMYSYIVKELPMVLKECLPNLDTGKVSVDLLVEDCRT